MPTVLAAIGLGVSNLQRSIDFYTKTLAIGLQVTETFDAPDFIETMLAFPKEKGSKAIGVEIALMQYKNDADNSVVPKRQRQGKLMFYVDDVQDLMERCKKAGVEVYSDYGDGDGVMEHLGIVRDPDEYLVEFLPMVFWMAAQGSKI
jgi:catechol 2,3-dioxygenase-like lactoylglutathione lyase family enzyme